MLLILGCLFVYVACSLGYILFELLHIPEPLDKWPDLPEDHFDQYK